MRRELAQEEELNINFSEERQDMSEIEQKFDVTGMTCAACSSHVEKSVRKLTGMQQVSVNLLTGSMQTVYDSEMCSAQDIMAAVERAGYGAQLPKEIVHENHALVKKTEDEAEGMKHRLLISIGFLIPLMYISMHHMLYEWFGIPVPEFVRLVLHGNENAIAFAFSQFLLLLPIVYVNRKYFRVGFQTLFHASPNMDSLIAIGASAAILYGIFAIFRIGYGLGHQNAALVEQYSMDIYFESAGTILTLITVGKYLEVKSKGKTSGAIAALMDLSPKTAIVVRKDGREEEIPTEEVKKGDIFILKPGSLIPVDGVVITGSSSVDEAAITGESIPVEKGEGDKVISTTMNKAGTLRCEAIKVGTDTTLSQIIRLVEEASASKAPIAKLADRIAGIFVPVVIGIALLSALLWRVSGADFEFAMSVGIAVLVISCPCALGLATPVAIMVGTGVGARLGVLIKSGEALQEARSVDTVVLDKTGTVTEGKPRVTDIICFDREQTETEIITLAGALEKFSEHPLAEAIVAEAESKNLQLPEVRNFKAFFGRGVSAQIEGGVYFAGNRRFMEENEIAVTLEQEQEIIKLAEEGKTPLLFGRQKSGQTKLIALVAVADTIKATSLQAIQELKEMHIHVIMLTGDNRKTAEAVRKKLGISEVIAEVLPDEKERKIRELKEQGKKVAMIGDGINDAPALAQADVGIAIGAGTDVALESADIILMKNNLQDAATAIRLSKAVIRNIKENLFWAFFYNAIGIPLAAGVLYPLWGIKLNPMFGAAAMSLSSVCVVANALRLRNFSKKY